MKQPTDENSSKEVAAIKALYAAINRNDIAAIRKICDPAVERFEPEGFPTAGVYRGLADVEAHLSKGRSTWAEGGCEPEKFVVQADRIIVTVHIHVRLNGKTDWIDVRIADGFLFRNSVILGMRSFLTQQEALKWAPSTSPRLNGEH